MAERTSPPISRRTMLRALALGAAATPSLSACGAAMGGAPANTGAAANDVTGGFSWKKAQGTTLSVLLCKHPYTESVVPALPEFTALNPELGTMHPGFITQYTREGAKDFEVRGGKLVSAMDSPRSVDEPLSHLDAAAREVTRRELKHLQHETGYTTVLVTHDQQEAVSMADRIVVMRDGSLQQVGTPDEVFDDPATLFVAGFVGEPAMNLRARVRPQRAGSLPRHRETPLVAAAHRRARRRARGARRKRVPGRDAHRRVHSGRKHDRADAGVGR